VSTEEGGGSLSLSLSLEGKTETSWLLRDEERESERVEV
jgi:hypothetical protein